MKEIKLTKGYFAIVDDCDFEEINKHKWTATKNGTKVYAISTRGGAGRAYMHRIISRAEKGQIVDHKNGDSLDNRRKNLRFCDKSKNGANSFKCKRKTNSIYKGVHWHKKNKKWRSTITVNGKTISLGCYFSEKQASQAYIKAAKGYFGEFARLSSRINK